MMETTAQNSMSFPKLNGLNWLLWKNNIRMTLILKNNWDVLDTERPAGGGRAQAEWDQKQHHALALIHLNCEPEQQGNILDAETGTEAWNSLKSLYEAANVANVAHLEEKFGQLRKKDNQTCQHYISEVRSMAAQLAAINAPITATRIANKILHGLPREYDPIVFGLTLPGAAAMTVDSVALQVLAAEQRLSYHTVTTVTATATATATTNATVLHQSMAAQHDNKPEGRQRTREEMQNMKCHFCQRVGHTQNYCFDKNPHLRPKTWNPRKRDSNDKENSTRGNSRGERGSRIDLLPPGIEILVLVTVLLLEIQDADATEAEL